MKPFMKFGFWMLLVFIFGVGVFLIVDFVLLNQHPVVSDVDAQMSERVVNYYTNSGSYSRAYTSDYDLGMAPQNILFSRESFPVAQFEGQRSAHPGDVLFASHPGDYMFYQSFFPGDIIIDGSSSKTKMRTIMTCGGCAQTMATCDWDCGATFSFCNMGSP